jgi:hypothetical protein
MTAGVEQRRFVAWPTRSRGTIGFEIQDSVQHGNGIPPRPRTPNGNVRQMRGFAIVAEPCEQAWKAVRRTSLISSVRTMCEIRLQLSDFSREQGRNRIGLAQRFDLPAKAWFDYAPPEGSRLKLRFVTGERSVVYS